MFLAYCNAILMVMNCLCPPGGGFEPIEGRGSYRIDRILKVHEWKLDHPVT